MKLHEEFKLYENMWESAETSAVIFVGNRRNKKALLDKVAKTNPAYTNTVFSVSDFLRQYENANKDVVKFYTDAEGKAELEQICADMPERMRKSILNATTLIESATAALNEDWYGADAEVEFETSVYPDIAKYFGLKDDEVVTYAYYYTDEVIVNYDDATGRSHEIEKHVPLDQVEDWFKAGYTILDEAKKSLTEARSVADIEAEIARLQQELEQAKVAEKKASYGGTLPKTVWTWDIYLEPAEKGTWTGIKSDLVFETKDKALDAAWTLLNELDDEGELEYDPDDYYVEAFEIPLSSVSKEVLSYSNLKHLI